MKQIYSLKNNARTSMIIFGGEANNKNASVYQSKRPHVKVRPSSKVGITLQDKEFPGRTSPGILDILRKDLREKEERSRQTDFSREFFVNIKEQDEDNLKKLKT